jgi:glycerol-3-phosphate dehydrogenase
MLTNLQQGSRFKVVPKREWGNLDGLKTHGLQKVFQYWDAQTDDVLLTRAVMRSAQDLGAELLMPCEFVSAELGNEATTVCYRQGDHETCVETRVIVNAAGPWVNEVLAKLSPQPKHLEIDLVQGSHIILEGHMQRGMYYMEAPSDQRAVFVLPWKDKAMVGTTETLYQGDPAKVFPLPEEKQYLLDALAHYFPAYRDCSVESIIDSFAGLRVLPTGKGLLFGRSRETIFFLDRDEHPRVLSIYGGKLTSYRATAEKVMKHLMPTLPARERRGNTQKIPLVLPED